MKCHEDLINTKRGHHHLYWSNRHKGRYVWKKGVLIDKTFPQVLDTMVEDFPDQLAIKYTTLDYTRTYSQFRDDVDEFARAWSPWACARAAR